MRCAVRTGDRRVYYTHTAYYTQFYYYFNNILSGNWSFIAYAECANGVLRTFSSGVILTRRRKNPFKYTNFNAIVVSCIYVLNSTVLGSPMMVFA